jgi:hypothetical protein
VRVALVAFALLRLGMRLEAGPEFDSNANHVDNPRSPAQDPLRYDVPPVAGLLVRTTARGTLAWSEGASAAQLRLDLGGKLFFDRSGPSTYGWGYDLVRAREAQDVLVVRVSGDVRHEVGRVTLGLGADYHDAVQWNRCPDTKSYIVTGPILNIDDNSCHRDFRQGSLRGSVTVRDGAPSLLAEVGVRGYQWKPLDDQSFVGVGGALTPALALRAGARRQHDIQLAATGRAEWRAYAGAALVNDADNGSSTAPRRTDVVASLALRASYFGTIFAAASWSVESDRSTSFAGSYLYQALTLDAVVPLPQRFSLGARAVLLYFQNGSLPTSQAVEDENRNAVMIDAARVFDHGLSLRARYQLFWAPASGSTVTGYLRQVGTLSLAWQTD